MVACARSSSTRTGCPGSPRSPTLQVPVDLVRVLACGLCGSDVEKLGRRPAGAVLGHEVEGLLEDGTRVTVMHRVPCGDCDRCRAGHESTCNEFQRAADRARRVCGAPASDARRPARRRRSLDGIWVEPLACILRAAERVPRGRVLVVGCGAIGSFGCRCCDAAGRGRRPLTCAPTASRRRDALARETADGAVDAAVVTAHGGLNDALVRVEPGGTLLVFAASRSPSRSPSTRCTGASCTSSARVPRGPCTSRQQSKL